MTEKVNTISLLADFSRGFSKEQLIYRNKLFYFFFTILLVSYCFVHNIAFEEEETSVNRAFALLLPNSFARNTKCVYFEIFVTSSFCGSTLSEYNINPIRRYNLILRFNNDYPSLRVDFRSKYSWYSSPRRD